MHRKQKQNIRQVNVKVWLFVFFIPFFLSGCAVLDSFKYYGVDVTAHRESFKTRQGVKFLMYLTEDGKSLCEGDCELRKIINQANSSPFTATMLYIFLYEYQGEVPVGVLGDSAQSYLRMTEIIRKMKYTFLPQITEQYSSSKANNLYDAYDIDREVFGLRKLSRKEFTDSLKVITHKNDKIIAFTDNLERQFYATTKAAFRVEREEYKKTHPSPPVFDTANYEYKALKLLAQQKQTPVELPYSSFEINGKIVIMSIDLFTVRLGKSFLQCQDLITYDKRAVDICLENTLQSLKQWVALSKQKSISTTAWRIGTRNYFDSHKSHTRKDKSLLNPYPFDFNDWSAKIRAAKAQGY